jgi:hypothetical protein
MTPMSSMAEPIEPTRRRTALTVAVMIAVIAAGAASRRYGFVLPVPVRKRTGDALWATAAFLAIGLVRPAWSTLRDTLVSVVVTFAIEFSQLSHARPLELIRGYTVGRLLIGVGFYWLDLLAYLVGISVAIPVDALSLCRPAVRRNAGAGDESPESACVR